MLSVVETPAGMTAGEMSMSGEGGGGDGGGDGGGGEGGGKVSTLSMTPKAEKALVQLYTYIYEVLDPPE